MIHPVPSSFVKVGPLQPISSAFSIAVSHSFCVGSRQSPGEDPSVNMQSPFFSPATAFFAASQSALDKQLDCFNQTSPVTLSVNQVARMDFKLALGGVSEAMTVVAAAPLIEKSTSEISTLIDEKQIENLPLNGRNFTQLATLVPGVTRGIPGSNAAGGGSGTDAETFRYSEFGGAALSVNGLREQFNNYQIEGIDNNESLVNSIAYLPPPEAIREFLTLLETRIAPERERPYDASVIVLIFVVPSASHGPL